MRAARIGVIVALLVVALVAVAWVRGGRQPLHEIRQPVSLPGGGQ